MSVKQMSADSKSLNHIQYSQISMNDTQFTNKMSVSEKSYENLQKLYRKWSNKRDQIKRGQYQSSNIISYYIQIQFRQDSTISKTIGYGVIISSNIILADLYCLQVQNYKMPQVLYFQSFSGAGPVQNKIKIKDIKFFQFQENSNKKSNKNNLAIIILQKQNQFEQYPIVSTHQQSLQNILVYKHPKKGIKVNIKSKLNNIRSQIQNQQISKIQSNHKTSLNYSVTLQQYNSGAVIFQQQESQLRLIGFHRCNNVQSSPFLFFDQFLVKKINQQILRVRMDSTLLSKDIKIINQRPKDLGLSETYQKYLKQEIIILKFTDECILIDLKDCQNKKGNRAKIYKSQIQDPNFGIVRQYVQFYKILIDALQTETNSFSRVIKVQLYQMLIFLGKNIKYVSRVPAQSYSPVGALSSLFLNSKEDVSSFKEYFDNCISTIQQKSNIIEQKNNSKITLIEQQIKNILKETRQFCDQFTKSFIKKSNQTLNQKIHQTIARFNNLYLQLTAPLKKIHQFQILLEKKIQVLTMKIMNLQKNYENYQYEIKKQIQNMKETIFVEKQQKQMVYSKFEQQIAFLMSQFKENDQKIKKLLIQCSQSSTSLTHIKEISPIFCESTIQHPDRKRIYSDNLSSTNQLSNISKENQLQQNEKTHIFQRQSPPKQKKK